MQESYRTYLELKLTLTLVQFAVRPNMRNHNTMKRDAIIKLIAGLVGQPHKVDLKNYDLLITVEIYQVRDYPGDFMVEGGCADIIVMQNICGVSVVDHRFEELKRYNISEIFDPTPKEEAKVEKVDAVEKAEEAVKEEGDEKKVVVTAETGKEVATDAKSTDDGNNGGASAVKDDEASEATGQGQGPDEHGVSLVQDSVQASVPDGSAGAP